MLRFWLTALARPALDLTLTTHPGLVTRIIERPGATLDDAGLAALVEQLRSVASRTLAEGALTYGVFSGERERLSRTIVTLITEKESGRPIAFNALAQMRVSLNGDAQEVTHLGLVMVDPDARGRGLSGVLYGLTVLVLFIRGGLRPRWISNVTQVPGVVGMVCQTFSDIYPSPDPGSRQSFTHLSLARQIMRDHRHVFGVGPEAGFDEVRSVITDAYTGGSDDLKKSFTEATQHREPRYNEFCAAELDYGRGDDVLQIGRMDLAAARRYLLGQVPRTSLPGLAGASAFLMLQRIVLPVFYWLDDSRRYGLLRPRPSRQRS
ncbi:MAG TPA: hypothetical protein VGN82_21805 [Bosea sp. (in: a-proteobacteria)]|jgi:hypothetical protein|uniref:hypothetical protein n=1 Tax=Bosea sp. (in: a-proteobacteria) TaxID=1871050 RepID=UPI002E129B74|nr:hypothetical protein [Bosea sp. (in: a-proteobacteria)]